jgi:hypothetical protein
MRTSFLLSIAAFFFVLSFDSIGAEAVIESHFDDFKVASEPPFNAAKVKISGTKSLEYPTALREAAHGAPNFAGHYIFTQIGCGASCIMSAIIDARRGNVIWLPFTVRFRDVEEPIEFKPDSRLIKIRGSRNEKGSGTYFYEFDGHQFTLIKESQ